MITTLGIMYVFISIISYYVVPTVDCTRQHIHLSGLTWRLRATISTTLATTITSRVASIILQPVVGILLGSIALAVEMVLS